MTRGFYWWSVIGEPLTPEWLMTPNHYDPWLWLSLMSPARLTQGRFLNLELFLFCPMYDAALTFLQWYIYGVSLPSRRPLMRPDQKCLEWHELKNRMSFLEMDQLKRGQALSLNKNGVNPGSHHCVEILECIHVTFHQHAYFLSPCYFLSLGVHSCCNQRVLWEKLLQENICSVFFSSCLWKGDGLPNNT